MENLLLRIERFKEISKNAIKHVTVGVSRALVSNICLLISWTRKFSKRFQNSFLTENSKKIIEFMLQFFQVTFFSSYTSTEFTQNENGEIFGLFVGNILGKFLVQMAAKNNFSDTFQQLLEMAVGNFPEFSRSILRSYLEETPENISQLEQILFHSEENSSENSAWIHYLIAIHSFLPRKYFFQVENSIEKILGSPKLLENLSGEVSNLGRLCGIFIKKEGNFLVKWEKYFHQLLTQNMEENSTLLRNLLHIFHENFEEVEISHKIYLAEKFISTLLGWENIKNFFSFLQFSASF
jgi:hypothetical protein